MLKSEKIEAGAAWSLRGLTKRTIQNNDINKVWAWTLFSLGLCTVVPLYYLGGWLLFPHAAHRQRLVEIERHKELVNATQASHK
jgi:hypothetical protein